MVLLVVLLVTFLPRSVLGGIRECIEGGNLRVY